MEKERADALEVAAQEDEESQEEKEDPGGLSFLVYFSFCKADCDLQAMVELIREKPDRVLPADPYSGARYGRTVVLPDGRGVTFYWFDNDNDGKASSQDILNVDVMKANGSYSMHFTDEGLDGFVLSIEKVHYFNENAYGIPLVNGRVNDKKGTPTDRYWVESAYRAIIKEVGVFLTSSKK